VGEAVQTLGKLEAEKVAQAGATGVVGALQAQAEALAAAERQLRQAEEALEKGQLKEARVALAAVDATGAGSEPYAAWRDALAGGVLDAAREAEEPAARFRAIRDDVLAAYEQVAGRSKQREDAWQQYYGGLKAFLEGETDQAVPQLRAVAAEPSGVRSWESANAQAIVGVIAEEGGVSAEAAKQLLVRAEASYDARSFVKAAALLEQLAGMPGYSMDADLRARSDALSGKVQAEEKKAAELYEQAQAAFRADDGERLRSTLSKLESRYKGTRVYRDNM